MNNKELLVTIIVTFAIGALIGSVLGEMNMCQKDRNYLYSYDFGKCIKIGKDNYK